MHLEVVILVFFCLAKFALDGSIGDTIESMLTLPIAMVCVGQSVALRMGP